LPLGTLVETFQPPHSANRHDAGCGGAGGDSLRITIVQRDAPLGLTSRGFLLRMDLRYTTFNPRSLEGGQLSLMLGVVMAYLETAILLFIMLIGGWLTISSLLWAIWYTRRSFRRSKQFSLYGLLFAFTVVALLMGVFALVVRGAA
jgi:hypothetical protein